MNQLFCYSYSLILSESVKKFLNVISCMFKSYWHFNDLSSDLHLINYLVNETIILQKGAIRL